MNSRIGMLVNVDISTQTPKTARKSDDSQYMTKHNWQSYEGQ